MSEREATPVSARRGGDGRPTVLIYRSRYGQLSETFVRDHVSGLSRHHARVLANRIDRCGGGAPVEVTVVSDESRLDGALWRRGWSWRTHMTLRARRPALIHAHFLQDGAAILPYARAHGIPLVVTVHGYDVTTHADVQAESIDGRLLLARSAALGAYAARFLCVSDFIRDEMLMRGFPTERLIVQPLGIDLDVIRPTRAVVREGIVAVGRLVEKKGTRFLIEAYAGLSPALRARHPLTVIGEGPLRSSLEALAASLDVRVTFTGGLPRERILAALEQAALFCFPSVRARSGDAEGMGIAIMEALALATPVVLFDDQPAAPILRRWQAATFARSGDAQDLARGIALVLEQPALAGAMAARGREACAAEFNLRRNLNKVEDLYTEVAAVSRR